MPVEYIRKTKLNIPSIGDDVPCIIVEVTTWCGWNQRYTASREAVPIGQKGITKHPRHASSFDPASGLPISCLSPSMKNFQEAVGKRVSWAKPPLD